MTFWKSICQLKFLSVVLGLLSSSFLALGENENPGKTPTPPTTEKNVTSAMALQTALNQSLSVQNLNEMSRLLAPSKIQVADLSQEAKDAKLLFDQLQSQGKLLSTLTNSALQTLPIAVPIDNTSQGYLMIKKATFYPDHVELDVYARLLLGDQEIYFGATGVKYVMASGIAGTVGLVMLGTQEFSNTQYKVSLTGGSMKNALPSSASQLKINCGSFAGLVIKGNLELNKDTFLKLDDKGYPMPDGTAAVVSSPIDYQATALTGLTVPVKNPLAFTLKKSQTVMGFVLANVSFDFSEKATPSAITSTVGSFLGNNSNMINQWTGLFATASTVYVPMFFIPATPKDPTPIRPSFQAGVLLLDDSGLYMNASGTGIANFSQLGGSPMTIDQISFTLEKSNYSNFSLSGKVGVLAAKSPFKKNDKSYDFSTLSKDEYLTYAGSLDDKSQSFSLKVNQQANMFFLGAKSTLRDDSKVDFVQDTPTYRNASLTTDGNGTSASAGGNTTLESIATDTATPSASSGLVTGTNRLQARLVTPKLSFRYVIGLDVNSKEVSYDTTSKKTNNDKILSLGVVLVEDLVVGYSFLSKKPIFKFTRMGYERLGNVPVFGKIGLKKLMAEYDDTEKSCTVNFTFYANVNPLSKQTVFDTGDTTKVKNSDTTSTLNITAGVDINFAWEVSETQTSTVDFKANFSGISLSTLRIATGSSAGFTLDGSISFDKDDEEYGTVCRGNITAEFKIKGVSKLAKAQGDDEDPRMVVNWIGGRVVKEDGSAYNFTYFDFLLSFGEAGILIGPTVKVNGFGAGVAVNMTQTNELGSRYSITGKKYLPREKTGGALFAVTFFATDKQQRGMLGIYAEGAKGTGAGSGFRKLSIFGTWEFARDSVELPQQDAKTALKAATVPSSSTTPPTNQQVNNLSKQQVNNAVKMLDVSLDDRFAILKFDLTFDASTDDFIMEGSAFGFMHVPLKKPGSYVRGAADDEGAGFLGMIQLKIVAEGLVKENKENRQDKKEGKPKGDNEPNPVNGYLWIGRPDQPLAIEVNLNLGKDESPTYLKIGATLFIVGGNVPLPSNQVRYYSIVENAKAQINSELKSRNEGEINFDLPTSVMQDGTRYFSLGLSLGGSVYLSTPTKAVSVYANLTFGFGFMVAYDKAFKSCNGSHWLGSGVLHGSGELGIVLNLKKTQTKFQIVKGSITAAGVFDFKGSYGAMMFEYTLMGGIVEGRAFMTFGDSPCLSPTVFELNSRVNLVKETSPQAAIFRSDATSDASATYNDYMIQRHEMIVLYTDPQIPVYQFCNLKIDGGQVIENVMIAGNYYSIGSPLKRYVHYQPNDRIRFVANTAEYDLDDRKATIYTKRTTLHQPNANLILVVELVITNGDQAPNSDWLPIQGTDFRQRFTFRTRVWDSFYADQAQRVQDGTATYYWYYIRNDK
ncbi:MULTISPECIES: hypothetical protein [unclassified Spirosoma]|uniref:hypothetical protein n=1 Tax=unclassified Spirosoma TaxID=2621999 RepID=UPI00095CDAC9|nr:MULTISPECIES: hypothetical protein [unclassified Spirosoma]MBN8824297.1 hypothetical protein [Spirosoma sp.]OJW70231.1 MAG: hypothetical protein BGO59_26555 [Spirosoma sp. 48-14]